MGGTMRVCRETKVLLLSAAIILAAVCPAFGQAGIYLDHADGFVEPGCVPDGGMVTFHMRVVGDEYAHLMLNNGFKICSGEMTWDDVTVEFNPAYPTATWFDFVRVANVWDGPQCDTIGIGLLSLFGSGLPPNFDGILYSITIGPVTGGEIPGATIVLDSSWFPPSNPWMWDIIGVNVDWGGPYTFWCDWQPTIFTYCAPQPTILKQIDRVLYIYLEGENVYNVDLASIRIQGNIPSYEPAYIDGNTIVASVFIMRFLGASGFRPVTGDFEATYTLDYNYNDGTPAPTLIGDYALKVYPGDVTLDGQGNIDDMIFAADYFWRDGTVPGMTDKTGQAWEITELLDANQDGSIDPSDVIALKNILGL